METVKNAFIPVLVLLTASAAAGISPVAAAVLEVDAAGGTPFQTIKSAISAAIPGVDSVFVRCGTYNEIFAMVDGVSVRGESADCTVIDGGQAGSVVTFAGVSAGTVLEGFTITNGRSELGGGILVEASGPTITRNIIVDNTAFSSGFGTGSGGGIHVTTPLAALAATAPVISRNVIRDNIADTFGGGISLYIDDGATILNNLIEGNTAGEAGGGIDAFASFPAIVGNTIVRNCLQSAGSACVQGGGGIALTDSGVSDIQWNVIVENEAAAGGGVDAIGSVINLLANDAFGNTPANYAGVADPTGTDGNLSVDPQFVDAAGGDYRLAAASPLLDAVAFSTDDVVPCKDLDGLPRVMEHDGDGVAEDLGAYERMLARGVGEVANLLFTTSTTLEWDPVTATGYNVYRDLLSSLSRTNFGVCFGSVAIPTLVDGNVPVSEGEGFFYLVTAVDALAEGTLGFLECEERSNFAPCP